MEADRGPYAEDGSFVSGPPPLACTLGGVSSQEMALQPDLQLL